MEIQFTDAKISLFSLLLFLSVPLSGQAQTMVSENRTRYTVEEKNQSLKVDFDGEITLGPDDGTIQAISDGGYLRIEKTTFGNSRELFINSSGGGLNYQYKEAGRDKPFEPAGSAWLSDILPEILRSTTIAAESRVDRLYTSGGVNRVIKELPELKSDHVRARYVNLLVRKTSKEGELQSIVNAVGSTVSSDHFRYEIFKTVFPDHSNNPALLLKAVKTMTSDHFKTQLIKPLINARVSAGQQQQALQLINTIQSDHFKTEIAKNLIFKDLSDRNLGFLLDNVVKEVKSDHFRYEILKSILNNSKQSDERLIMLIGNVESLSSDHFKAEFLKQVCNTGPGEKVMSQIRNTAKSIKSTHFFGEVMRCAS